MSQGPLPPSTSFYEYLSFSSFFFEAGARCQGTAFSESCSPIITCQNRPHLFLAKSSLLSLATSSR